ncbi:Eco57I restriction-modification methylase domain-containing protein [Haliovirga abyssi]|uniref:site-specific DNA-methyltransferase (adenine-specific) n=1 Tax=Haliovirga abyssi TaxID=2996794 RepID=A0AAU9DQI9_9FUSO|nr:TaqI-like C-terminal specificity domain-containing protein [Haliovirga abyssi]BDU50743.1 SAM-dependent methyltransferase [Haliovirga abyssi]
MYKFGYDISDKYETELGKKFSVYTPQEITRKMLAISFYKYFKDGDRKEKLKNLKLIDLSCGTGNFLVESLNFLIKISKIYFGEYKFFSNWITGYDIDKDSIDIAKIRLKKILKSYNINDYSFEKELNIENSLLKTFEVNYDIVVGNPPYLGEKNNREFFIDIKNSEFGKKYYEGKMDYLYFFIEKGIEILKKNGILTYITTNYWFTADYAKKLRATVKANSQFYYIEDLNKSVFKRALGQHNMIFSLIKMDKTIKTRVINDEIDEFINSNLLYTDNCKIVTASNEKLIFFNKMNKKCNFKLGDILNINQGIVSGYDKAFVRENFEERFSKYLKPFYKSKDILNYKIKDKNDFWILYLDKNIEVDSELLKELLPFKERLEKRREVKNGLINWYNLQWGRKKEIFENEKIVGRQRGSKNLFSYSNSSFYGSADIYYLTLKQTIYELNLFYILGYLNSKMFFDWFYYNGKKKGQDLELYSTPLKSTPIYYPDNLEKIEYISKLVKEQIENYTQENQEKIDKFFRWEI